ncbi:MAG: AMP-binding protein, partial [Burkholderiaceae bacterium]
MNFASGLERYGNQTALVLQSGEHVSYKDLAHRADATYATDGAPANKRSLVAIECNNQVSSVAGYLGALRNDFPALLVDATLPLELRERLYGHFSVSCILDSDGHWRSGSSEIPETHPTLALLLSTSGSTGASKLVKLTLANLQANATAITSYLLLNGEERPITTLPLHYSYGLSVLNSHLTCGATLLLTSEPVTSRTFWDFFRQHEATSFAGVPAMYSMLKQLRFERMALPSLRCLTQAGGQLATDLIHWHGELSLSRKQRFYVMYGQTEATARMSYVPCERIMEKAGSVGIPIPNGHIELVADDGNLISASDVVGELRYSGPNVMMGYAENISDLSIGDVQGATLLTG